MKTKSIIFALTTSAAFLAVVSIAFAEISREEYKARVEPICQANTKANEKTLHGVKTEVKKGKLKRPATQVKKAAAALKGTLAQLEAIEEPEANKATLQKWLGQIKTEVSVFEAVAKKLKAGNKNAAEHKVITLEHNAEAANTTVIGFEFKYCKANPSKFV